MAETRVLDDEHAEHETDLRFLEPSANECALGRIGKYDVLGILGRGGMGVVFDAFDDVLHRHVAIKVLTPELSSSAKARRRFLREARAAAAINHPNVIIIHAVDEQNGMPYLVMEYVSGRSLRDRMRRSPQLELIEIVRIGAQIATGLDAAHAQGVIHRDIKPSNVLLEDGIERVKIADFGLARAAMDLDDITTVGQGVGTPAYVSPEQVNGGDVDQRSDLFSFGCLLYAMVDGHSPFRGKLAIDVLRRVADHHPTALAKRDDRIPQWFSDLVDKLLQKDPNKRYQTAREVAAELHEQLVVLNQMPSDRLPKVVKAAAPRPAFRRKRYAGLAALAALAVAAFSYLIILPLLKDRGSQTVTSPLVRHQGVTVTDNRPPSAVVSVSQSGAADFRSLAQAVAEAPPRATIRILDDAVYEGPISLTGDRYAGLHIESPQRATLRSTSSNSPVLSLNGVPNVLVQGLRISASKEQHAVWIGGRLDGAHLVGVECEHPPQAKCGVAVIDQATGAAESPIVIQGCSFTDDYVGLAVLGQPGKPVDWLLVEHCRFQMAGASVGITMENAVEHVTVSHCVVAGEGTASGIHLSENVRDVSILNNTFHRTTDWIGLHGEAANNDVAVRRNLVLESRYIIAGGTDFQRLVDACLSDNLWELAPGTDESQIRAVCAPRLPPDQLAVVSRDPDDAAYLQPLADSPITGLRDENGSNFIGAIPPGGDPPHHD
ncbi:MAG TPA: protein kinase [Pirellulales bacterium]|nr:protein kinase [Pirellulales bacterium]